MKITKNQLKRAIKQIVRETIEERHEKKQTLFKKHLTEAGLTSETENQTQGYNENEEIMLIKVMKLIADKLLAMHGNQATPTIGMATAEYPADNQEDNQSDMEIEAEPEDGDDGNEGEEIPTDNDNVEEIPLGDEEPENNVDGDEENEVPADNETPEDKEEDEENLEEASYKKIAKRAYETSKDMKARTIQYDPEVTENFKVQTRSYRTSDDNASDPNKVRDPEIPQV